MKTWIKGGLIGILIAFVLLVISIIFNINFLQDFLARISFWSGIPFIYIYQLFVPIGTGENYGLVVIFIFLGLILEFFIIGAFIGWLVGKFRGRNENIK